MFESLRTLSDRQVLAHTDAIVVQDRKLTVRLLEHLHEIERRKLYLKLACSSMFDYCRRHLRLSEPAAARRIRTARCLARFPRLHDLLASGDINLTTASMVAKLLTPSNADAIIGRIKGKSKREVERVVAEYEPRAVLPPDRVRPVVVSVGKAAYFGSATVAGDSEISPRIEASLNERDAPEHATASCETLPAPQDAVIEHEAPRVADIATTSHDMPRMIEAAVPRRETPQFERRLRIEFTAHEALMAKLERIRSIASHRLPATASFEQLVEFMADYMLKREDPAAREQRREVRDGNHPATEELARAGSPRQIAARVRDQVFVRDRQCTYVGADGMLCGSTHVLQIDHIKPISRGGASTIDNLRLLCAYHNRLEAERPMGNRRPSA